MHPSAANARRALIGRFAVSTDLCAIRRTTTLEIETPLLVPSFSSRGFPGLVEMIGALRPDVAELCLVSAFDIVRGFCPETFETLADIVVVDSGVYEGGKEPVAVEAYLPPPSGSGWSRSDYRSFLNSVGDRWRSTNTIIVSFDTFAPFTEQIRAAREDFEGVVGAATDLLLKPEEEGGLHSQFSRLDDNLRGFDVLGVTERELGSSAMERCRALVRLRAALTRAGLNIPIHVFGSITPAAVTAYFLCGADMFDGLNWLRTSLDLQWAGATSEFAVAHGLASEDDHNVQLELWRRNLRVLRRTQGALRRFTVDRDIAGLTAALPFAERSLDLANRAIDAERG